MALAAYHCVACGYTHLAPAWFFRKSETGVITYVCAEKLDTVKEKRRWRPLDSPQKKS